MSDEIHDMIMQFNTGTMGMDEILNILDKLNEKIDYEISVLNENKQDRQRYKGEQ